MLNVRMLQLAIHFHRYLIMLLAVFSSSTRCTFARFFGVVFYRISKRDFENKPTDKIRLPDSCVQERAKENGQQSMQQTEQHNRAVFELL